MKDKLKNKLEPGDRVRIVAGPWAPACAGRSDCGMVTAITQNAVRVRADSRGYVVFVRPQDLERIG